MTATKIEMIDVIQSAEFRKRLDDIGAERIRGSADRMAQQIQKRNRDVRKARQRCKGDHRMRPGSLAIERRINC